MDTYSLKWTGLHHALFRLFCIKTGRVLNLRGVAKLLKVTPTTVSNSLAVLEKEKLINVKKSKTMNLLSIELNRDNKRTLHLKRTENLKLVYECGLYDFLYNQFPGCTIVVFGSYSRGEDVYFGEEEEHNSDIDIAIVGSKEKEIDLSKLEKSLERKIHLNFYESWKSIHKNLKESILGGILLSGGVEL